MKSATELMDTCLLLARTVVPEGGLTLAERKYAHDVARHVIAKQADCPVSEDEEDTECRFNRIKEWADAEYDSGEPRQEFVRLAMSDLRFLLSLVEENAADANFADGRAERALAVECPTCKARPRQCCTLMLHDSPNYGKERSTLHLKRYKAGDEGLGLRAICPDCGDPVPEAGWTCGQCRDDHAEDL